MSEEDPEIERARALVGHVLDEKWTLLRLIGAGSMGAVYAARHRNGARAAVKLLHPELARVAEIRDRFLREGYAANRVEHAGAVKVLDDDIVKEGPDAGTAYLVMELLEGESLEDKLERGEHLDERELLELLDEVLEVLAAAHAHGVIHRDLKPANLFLARDGTVKVLDFGLARVDTGTAITRNGLAMGTPSFMAPEQATGRMEDVDGRTDLFALGATAFVIASGKTVHDASGVLELVAKMGTLPAPKLRDVAKDVSPELAAIVDRALAFARDDRYPDAASMRADVRARLAELDRPTEPPPAPSFPLFRVALLALGAGAAAVALRPMLRTWLEPRHEPPPQVHAPVVEPPVDAAPVAAAHDDAGNDASIFDAAADATAADAGLDAGDDDDDDDDDAGADAGIADAGIGDAGTADASFAPHVVPLRTAPHPPKKKPPKKRRPKRR